MNIDNLLNQMTEELKAIPLTEIDNTPWITNINRKQTKLSWKQQQFNIIKSITDIKKLSAMLESNKERIESLQSVNDEITDKIRAIKERYIKR